MGMMILLLVGKRGGNEMKDSDRVGHKHCQIEKVSEVFTKLLP